MNKNKLTKENILEAKEIIKDAATTASEKIYEICQDLKSAEDEAESECGVRYNYDYRIMQELEDGYTSGLRAELEDIANGDKDDMILEELGLGELED
jgi:hypothetical protein